MVEIPTEGWLVEVLQFVLTAKGLSALAIAAGATQLVMKFFQTPLSSFAGIWKLVIVSGLSVVSLVIAGMASGLPLLGALLSGPALAALQVFVNEVIKHLKPVPVPQLIDKKAK